MPRSEAFEREIHETYSDIIDGLASLETLSESPEAGAAAASIRDTVVRLRTQVDRHFDQLGSLYFEELTG
ncbi:MAG: hypothetical protein WCJ64_25645 [Rhodospirillaceae bacterium]